MRAPLLALPLLLVTSGCGWTDLEDFPCPDGGTRLTYANFGRGFLGAYCNRCHAAGAEDRRGAPRSIIFDTYEQAKIMATRIFVRSAAENTTMPPGPDDPPEEARYRLAEWIACGTPR